MIRYKFYPAKKLEWKCKCGNTVPDDRNFCIQCERERPFGA